MSDFAGISAESLMLLAENRFHDSKAFYEEHKPAIRAGVVEPLRQLVAELAPTVLAIDPKMVVDPLKNGCVSRVRRDNRFTHDKSLYRENMWIAFMRDKQAWDYCLPAFYMDFSLSGVEWGMGFYSVTPAVLQVMRRQTTENPKPMEKAIKTAAKAGFALTGQPYARRRSGEDVPPALRPIYDCKNLVLTRQDEPSMVSDSGLVQRLQEDFTALAPLYRLFMQAVEENVMGDERE